jgi:hypothetical protein
MVELDETYTAYELAADWLRWYWEGYCIKIKGGRTLYEYAKVTRFGNVRLSRLEPREGTYSGIRKIYRTVNPATEMVIVDE